MYVALFHLNFQLSWSFNLFDKSITWNRCNHSRDQGCLAVLWGEAEWPVGSGVVICFFVLAACLLPLCMGWVWVERLAAGKSLLTPRSLLWYQGTCSVTGSVCKPSGWVPSTSAIVTDSCDCYHALTVVLRGGLDTMDGLLINLLKSEISKSERFSRSVSSHFCVKNVVQRVICVCWTDLMHGLVTLVSLNYWFWFNDFKVTWSYEIKIDL